MPNAITTIDTAALRAVFNDWLNWLTQLQWHLDYALNMPEAQARQTLDDLKRKWADGFSQHAAMAHAIEPGGREEVKAIAARLMGIYAPASMGPDYGAVLFEELRASGASRAAIDSAVTHIIRTRKETLPPSIGEVLDDVRKEHTKMSKAVVDLATAGERIDALLAKRWPLSSEDKMVAEIHERWKRGKDICNDAYPDNVIFLAQKRWHERHG